MPPEPSNAADRDQAAAHRLCVEKIAVERDQSAFAVIYDHFGPRVKSFVMARNIDAKTAEDLAQEVMLTVWRKAHQYQADKASVSTWVFTIARNRMIDDRRVVARRARLDLDDPSQARPDPSTPEEELSQTEEAKRVTAALNALPAAQADILRLSFMEGHSHHEIADRLALPLGTVKSRIRLAKQRLVDYFGGQS